MLTNKTIEAKSLLHFITNDRPQYIRIKNLTMQKYLYIGENNAIYGNDEGTILIITPTYQKEYLTLKCAHNELFLNTNVGITGLSVATFQITSGNNKEILFYVIGNLNCLYIGNLDETPNIFGAKGRFLYMSEDGTIHTDGDRSIMTSQWVIEKINDVNKPREIRTDYYQLFDNINKESAKNISNFFNNMTRMYTIQNVKSSTYMNVSLEDVSANVGSVISTTMPNKFNIRPSYTDNTIYISYIVDNQYYNLYTIPNDDGIYMGAPDCDWAKFYLVKKNNYYLLQTFHRESDIYGSYGRYICISEVGDIECQNLKSNGTTTDISMWKITLQ